MQKIKEVLTGTPAQPETHHSSHHEHHTVNSSTHSSQMGEVVSEHPVAVGVAEVPVVVTEQERVSTHQRKAEVEVCGQKTFTEVEDRPVVHERVERIMEHRPVEKQYVVETRFVGERELGSNHTEIVDVKERIVEVAQPGPTCPANTGAIMEQVIGGVTGGVTGHSHIGGGRI